jgi:hypothetical protein
MLLRELLQFFVRECGEVRHDDTMRAGYTYALGWMSIEVQQAVGIRMPLDHCEWLREPFSHTSPQATTRSETSTNKLRGHNGALIVLWLQTNML